MNDTKQPEALRLADALESRTTSWPEKVGAAVALRRLHAENALLRQQRDAAQEVAAMNARSGASWAARVQELESQPSAGWVTVPVEPTNAMRAVIDNEHDVYESADALYAALLAAAPKAEPADPLQQLTELSERAGLYDADFGKPAGEYPALPKSYMGSVLTSGSHDGCKVTFNFSSVAEADAWHDSVTSSKADRAMRAQAAPAAVAGPVRWPENASEVRQFIGSHFQTLKFGQEGGEPHDNDLYELSAHDLLSAIRWWTDDAPTTQAAPVAQGDAEDAARYRYIRDVPISDWPDWLVFAIQHQQNAKWDAAIDAARSQAKEGEAA